MEYLEYDSLRLFGLGSVAMRIIAFNNLSEDDYKIVSLNAYN